MFLPFISMNIDLIVTGKTNVSYIMEGVAEYEKRLIRYIRFRIVVLPEVKNASSLTPNLLKQREAEAMLLKFQEYDRIILLDEKGKECTSEEFAVRLERMMSSGLRNVAFVVGGAYGFDECIYRVAQEKISISKMTFSHQMIRLLFIEQLYRAMTILRGEPYHHR